MVRKMKRSKKLDKIMAYHEAGHGVMAYYKDKSNQFALTIDVPEDIAGEVGGCMVYYSSLSRPLRKIEGLILLAGMSAAGILRECVDEYREDRNRSDKERFCKLWKTKQAIENNWNKLFLEAYEFLSQPIVWGQVKVIARMLLIQRRLVYGEVVLCMESVTDEEREKDLRFLKKKNKPKEP